MKDVWNVEKRVMEKVQEGVLLHGQDITTPADFVRIWQEVHGNESVTAKHLQIIYKQLCLRKPLPVMASEAELVRQVRHELAKIYAGYAHAFQGRKGQGGRDSHIKFQAVAGTHRAGLQSIVQGNTGPYYRSAHSSNPSVNSAAHAKSEYHLTSGQEGRATSAQFTGLPLVAFYYSIHHAAATYSYHLVTYKYHDDVGDEDLELPLLGGTVDSLLGQRPF